MPKYKDKMRLLRYLDRHGRCDSLTEHLILKGYPDNIAESGLEIFVGSWEESASWMRKKCQPCLAEYYYDLWQRSQLFIVSMHATPDQIADYQERIAFADKVFRDNNIETMSSCEINPDEIKQPNRERHWWLFRTPKTGIY